MFRNKATAHGILLVVALAIRHASGKSRGLRAAELAAMYEIPLGYASKTLGQLARARILRSVRGANGGFALAREPEDITLLEVVEATDGVVDGRQDAEDSGLSGFFLNGLRGVYGEVSDSVRDVLAHITVKQFMDEYCERATVSGS